MDKAEVIVAVGPHGIACEYIDVLAKLFLIHLIPYPQTLLCFDNCFNSGYSENTS